MARFMLLVIGEDAYNKVDLFSENREVEPRVRYRYSDRARDLQRAILRDKERLRTVDLSFNLDAVLEQYLDRVKMSPDEYDDWRTTYVGGDKMPCDDDGNVLTTSNPRGETDYWSWVDFPVRTEDGVKWEIEARYGDIDWELFREHIIKELIDDWNEETSRDPDFIDKLCVDSYEDYLDLYGRYCTDAVIDDDGLWYSPGIFRWFGYAHFPPPVERRWRLNFKARFLDPMDAGILLTQFSCHY